MVAFTRAVSETLGDEKKWVHYGLTSTDVVDTAYGYQLKQVNDVLRKDLQQLLEVIGEKAKEHKHTVTMGRTHGVHAEPTTFGLKLALWYSEMKRHIERFEHAAKGVEAGKISGAVGTFANIPPFVEKYVCDKLGTRPQEISTQVLPAICMRNILAPLPLLQPALKSLRPKSEACRSRKLEKWKKVLLKVRKAPQQCLTNVTRSDLRIWSDWRV